MKTESLKSILAKAVMSGMMIGIGGTIYLLVENKYLGSFLFSFGLFTIIQYGFALYTGKVGYIPEKKPSYIKEVLATFLGNAIGTGIAALMISYARIGDAVHQNAVKAMETKTGDTIISQIILGIFCGLLMYLAVENSKVCREKGNDFSMVFGTVMPIMIFILCGFNHSVADCFYMYMAGISGKSIIYILTVFLANAVGGMLVPLMKKLFDK